MNVTTVTSYSKMASPVKMSMNVHLLRTCVLTNASTLKEVTCALVTMATYWTGTSSTVQILMSVERTITTAPSSVSTQKGPITVSVEGGLS